MVRTEDKEFEKEIIEGGSHIAVPFQVKKMADGALDLLVYSFAVKIAEEFEAEFSADPFSEELATLIFIVMSMVCL